MAVENKPLDELLLKLMDSQRKVNDEIQSDWIETITYDRVYLAILSELGELSDSLAYEWWKKVQLDEENVKTEIVDIAHFIFTIVLKVQYDYNYSIDYSKIELPNNAASFRDFNILRGIITNLIHHTNNICDGKIDSVEPLLNSLLELILITFNSIVEFSREFIIKNALNISRTRLGYKNGTYQKYINGIEDNIHIKELVNDIEDIDVDKVINIYINWYKQQMEVN